jgi:hypothetical protein
MKISMKISRPSPWSLSVGTEGIRAAGSLPDASVVLAGKW